MKVERRHKRTDICQRSLLVKCPCTYGEPEEMEAAVGREVPLTQRLHFDVFSFFKFVAVLTKVNMRG